LRARRGGAACKSGSARLILVLDTRAQCSVQIGHQRVPRAALQLRDLVTLAAVAKIGLGAVPVCQILFSPALT